MKNLEEMQSLVKNEVMLNVLFLYLFLFFTLKKKKQIQKQKDIRNFFLIS